jgi:beta-N-acetylhexosaminidase
MGQGAYILGCEGTTLKAWEREFFREANPFGFILFARNVDMPAQLRKLTSDLRECVGWNAPVLIDQEGGRVQRLLGPVWREYLPPMDQMERVAPEHRLRSMYLRNLLIGSELMAVGIDTNCAPTADIAQADTHPFLRNRLYGSDVETVVKASMATAEGLMAAGVLPVLKHMPGHGRALVDSHLHLPTVDAPKADLMARDFAPFKALNSLPMGMSAHIVFKQIDPDAPATTSPVMMDLVRSELEFDNLIMTDDISMEALSGTVATRSRDALDAGCDIVLHCNGEQDDMIAVAEAGGNMTSGAQTRANRAVLARSTPDDIDIAAAAREFEGYLNA